MPTTFTATATISDGELLNFAKSLGYRRTTEEEITEEEITECKEVIANSFKKSAENFAGQWIYNKSEAVKEHTENQLKQAVSSIIDVTYE